MIYKVSHFNLSSTKFYLFLILEKNISNKSCISWRRKNK